MDSMIATSVATTGDSFPSMPTLVLTVAFCALYLFGLIRHALRDRIDLYDLIMLSAVAIVPAVFVLFPSLAFTLAEYAGVAFPMVVLFGILFWILFIHSYHQVVRVSRLRKTNTMLVQELSLLKMRLDEMVAREGHGKADRPVAGGDEPSHPRPSPGATSDG